MSFSSLLNSLWNSKGSENKGNGYNNSVPISQGKEYILYKKSKEKRVNNEINKFNGNDYQSYTSSSYTGSSYTEGFNGMMVGRTKVHAKNNKEYNKLKKEESTFNQSINDYNATHQNLMDKSQTFLDGTRVYGTNIHAVQASYTPGIMQTWVGCYKSGNDGLVEQEDLGTNTNVTSCKERASDLGYTTFALRQQGTTPGNTCFVGNSINQAQSNGLAATKSITSYSFKKAEGANIGGLMMNGQIGMYQDTITNNLVTDLTAVADCDITIGATINPNTIVASYGYNCNGTAQSPFTPPPPQPVPEIPTPDGYTKYPTMDSNGNDIVAMTSGTSIADLAAACDGNANCAGFNTGGDLKYAINPQSEWNNLGNNWALYVKNKNTVNIDTSKQYRLQDVNSTNCLYNNTDGRFNTFTCIDFNDQYWDIIPVSGEVNTYQFRNANSIYSLYADTNGNFSTSYATDNSGKFWWELIPVSGQEDTYMLKNKATNTCMYNNADGRFNMFGCVPAYDDQWWKLIPITTTGISGAIGPLSPIRYIRISTNNNYIQISQLAVYAADNPSVNIAPGKNTGALNTAWGLSSNPIDGVLNNRLTCGDSYCSSATASEAWVLDLLQEYPISKIVYYNRGDCCQDRAESMTLTLVSAANTVVWTGTPFTSDLIQTINIIPQPNDPIPVVTAGSTVNIASLWGKPWVAINDGTWANSLAILNDGTIICTNGGGDIFTRANLSTNWTNISASSMSTISSAWDGGYPLSSPPFANTKCIDQNNGDTSEALQMQIMDCNGNANQQISYSSSNQAITVNGGLCFDVYGGGTADGTPLIQYQCHGGPNQEWVYGTDKTLRPQNAPDKCLDALAFNDNYSREGPLLGIWDCNGFPNQTWNINQPISMKGVIQLSNGTYVGVGLDNNLYTKTVLTGNWNGPVFCCLVSVTQLNDGTLIGVASYGTLFKSNDVNLKIWTEVTCPASCCVTFVSTLTDGSIVGVGTNGLVYTRKTIDSPWVLSDGSMAMSSVTQLKDGTIIGTSQAGYFFRK